MVKISIKGDYSLLLLINVNLNVPFRCIGSDEFYWNLLLNSVSIQCTSSLQNLRIKTILEYLIGQCCCIYLSRCL